MKKGRFITPVTLLSFAILCIFFACAGFANSALDLYTHYREPGMADPGLFEPTMTSLIATFFTVVALLLLSWRRRIQKRLRGDRALGFPIAIDSTPPNTDSENSA